MKIVNSLFISIYEFNIRYGSFSTHPTPFFTGSKRTSSQKYMRIADSNRSVLIKTIIESHLNPNPKPNPNPETARPAETVNSTEIYPTVTEIGEIPYCAAIAITDHRTCQSFNTLICHFPPIFYLTFSTLDFELSTPDN